MLDNPFSDPSIPSLEWVRDEICRRHDLSHQHRMDMVSACNAAGRWFDLPLSAIPARASFLRPKFERLHPARVSVSQRRIDNVKSLILRAFREVRIATNLQPYGCALTPEWQDLYDRVEDRYIKTCLCRFFRFCSRQGSAQRTLTTMSWLATRTRWMVRPLSRTRDDPIRTPAAAGTRRSSRSRVGQGSK